MKTIKKVEIEPVFVEYIPETLEERKVYISERFGVSIHKCLCGCGVKTVLPFNKRDGWNLIKNSDGKVSFTPSILNDQYPCKAHYVITKNVANFI